MATKELIASGVGFSPGSTAYIPTRGLTPTSVTLAILTRGLGVNLQTPKYIPTAGFLSIPGNINLEPVIVHTVMPAIGVSIPLAITLTPVVTHAVIPAVAITMPVAVAITLAPVVVYTELLALANDVPTLPGVGPVTKGYISDKPQITYDGSGLVNRIIPFGVDWDDSDLTLEHADPETVPYTIQNDGETWYIEDAASITKYGLYEQRIYRTDVKNPYMTRATGALSLGANPTAGDSFTIGADTYTYTASPAAPLDIGLGATLPATRMNTYAAMVAADGLNSPPTDVEVIAIDPSAIAPPTVDAFGNWTSLPPWAGMTAGDPSAIPITALAAGPAGNVATTSDFTSAANGFAADTLLYGALASETANVLYALAVNDLIRRRSEILSMRVAVANGADIWALPGDRVQVVFNGVADTLEAESLGGSGRVTWLSIDRPMLVVERHDKSDASGVRQVEFVLACPMLEYAVPAVPEWTDPVSLPVPGETGIGNEGPGADWMADGINDILTNNKLPFPSCCPETSTDITRGTDLLPPMTSGEPDPADYHNVRVEFVLGTGGIGPGYPAITGYRIDCNVWTEQWPEEAFYLPITLHVDWGDGGGDTYYAPALAPGDVFAFHPYHTYTLPADVWIYIWVTDALGQANVPGSSDFGPYHITLS